ncbi:TFIIB-type zinc ribbon-containing protein [Agrococcus baldri]|uniref:Transcription factor zinc-finger domain-containing protein n=1 Tax=Agrococcus baldri TaxID=153730 RepID=A0AA87REE9_9MICO|nr:zf-TFIIB domain-containing protein [Agrococcus baldri]GEK81379.1 hypothetical protein ABA31_27300 [Agrococcus baldri]
MQCPNDSATLVMSERSGIEIDYCPECRGIWLDRGELDKLIERSYEQSPAYDQAPPSHDPRSGPAYGQPAPYGQQPAGYAGQPGHGQQGSNDTVGRIADKVMRTVQQRASGQRGQGQRGGRSWLGDILR